MKTPTLSLAIFLVAMDLVYCEHLKARIVGKASNLRSRAKIISMDKKAVAYGVGAVKKAIKGTVSGVVGKPLKVIGVLLGPLGLPLKIVGTALTGKSILEKAGAIGLVVKKLSRDSVRYG